MASLDVAGKIEDEDDIEDICKEAEFEDDNDYMLRLGVEDSIPQPQWNVIPIGANGLTPESRNGSIALIIWQNMRLTSLNEHVDMLAKVVLAILNRDHIIIEGELFKGGVYSPLLKHLWEHATLDCLDLLYSSRHPKSNGLSLIEKVANLDEAFKLQSKAHSSSHDVKIYSDITPNNGDKTTNHKIEKDLCQAYNCAS
ncbi:hypothetical protein ACJX0J_016076 [Zea mays]